MYGSVFPIYSFYASDLTLIRTNVYEESALGIYAVEEEVDGKSPSFVGAHLRNQLHYDLWYVFLGLFIIAIAEGARIESKQDYVSISFMNWTSHIIPCLSRIYRRLHYSHYCLRWSAHSK